MNKKTLDFRYLKAFLLVAETRSFTEAAARLKVAQSAISRQIRLFEESARTQLFIRSKQDVVLTKAGERLYGQAKIFADWCEQEFFEARPEIRIGSIQGVLETWLIDKIQTLDPDRAPNLVLRVMTDESIEEALTKNEIDFGFTAVKIDNENVTSRKLFEERFGLISKEPVEISRLHEHTWISSERAYYLNRLSKKRAERHIKVSSNDAIQRLVASGLGVAVLPMHVIDKSHGFLIDEDVPIAKGHVYLAMPNYRIMPAHLTEMLRLFSGS